MKRILLTLTFALVMALNLTAQSAKDVFEATKYTWYGIDYSKVYLIGSGGFADPANIKRHYFEEWNNLVINESYKYDLYKFFNNRNVEYKLDIVEDRNDKRSIDDMVVNNTEKASHLTESAIQEIIKEYNDPEGKGVGVVFICESLDKLREQGNYYVTFFDIPTKRVLLSKRLTGPAKGIGFRNYWANSFYEVMGQLKSKMSKWKKETAKKK